MTSSDPTDAVVQVLLQYLERHPQAADSVSGVERWWVGEDRAFSAEQVRRALDLLVERGVLRHERLADGTDWYAGAPPPCGDQRLLH